MGVSRRLFGSVGPPPFPPLPHFYWKKGHFLKLAYAYCKKKFRSNCTLITFLNDKNFLYLTYSKKKLVHPPPHHFSNIKLKVPSSLLFQNLCNEPGFKIKKDPLKSSAIHIKYILMVQSMPTYCKSCVYLLWYAWSNFVRYGSWK